MRLPLKKRFTCRWTLKVAGAFLSFAFGLASPQVYALDQIFTMISEAHKTEELSFYQGPESSSVWISKFCLGEKRGSRTISKCRALDVLNSKPRLEKIKAAPEQDRSLYNPAQIYCFVQKGRLANMTTPSGAQSEFCIFQDASAISAWGLIKAHRARAEPGPLK